MGGFPKPLLHIDGTSFVERTSSVLRDAGVTETVVVLGYEHEEVTDRVTFDEVDLVINREFDRGMLSSVQSGVERIQGKDVAALLLWPVDFAVVTVRIVERLLEAFEERPDSDVVVPTVDGDRGHPALFAASTFDPLLTAPDERGAKAVVYAEDTEVREVEVGDRRIHVDIDTPEEYWTAVKRYTE